MVNVLEKLNKNSLIAEDNGPLRSTIIMFSGIIDIICTIP